MTNSLFFLPFQISFFSFDLFQRWFDFIFVDNVIGVNNDLFALEEFLDARQNSIRNFDTVDNHKEGHNCKWKLMQTIPGRKSLIF